MENLDFNQHTSKKYNQELEKIRSSLLVMGGMVEKQVKKAVEALVEGKSKMAKKVIKKDLGVNAMEVQIDEECTQIIAKRQPAASDLRLVYSIIKSITDFERIGDEAEKIAKCASFLIDENYLGNYSHEFMKLYQLVAINLNQTLNALARLDAEEALTIAKKDEIVDLAFERLNNDIIRNMTTEPTKLNLLLRLSWSAKALEKIGDHTTNICEYIIYLVKGKDVRHLDINTIKEEYF